MGTHERRDRERGALKSLIMDAARQLFAAQGYEAVSMRRIADAIEYSPTAIYVYFKDKDALIREMCREDFAKLSNISNEMAEIGDPIERVRQLGYAYIRFAVKHPNHYRLMFMTPEKHGEIDPQDLAHKGDPSSDAYAFLQHTVQQALEAGRFRPELGNAVLITQIFWSMVHGIASLQIAKGNDPWIDWEPLEARIGLGVDAIIQGMVVDASSRNGLKASARKSNNRAAAAIVKRPNGRKAKSGRAR